MAENEASSAGQSQTRRRSLKWLPVIALMVAAAGAAYWWFFHRNQVSTDNAYVRVDAAQISSRIPGTIQQVFVENDYPVEQGQVLVELDPTDYQVAFQKAEAALAQDEAEVRAAELAVPLTDVQTTSRVQAAEAALQAARDKEKEIRHRLEELESRRSAASADVSQLQRDTERLENLYRQGAGTERQKEQVGTDLKKARAQSGAVEAQIAAARASLAATAQEINRARAELLATQSERRNVEIQQYRLAALKGERDKSRADLEAARLNLSYCKITAPLSGYIAQKSIQVGNRIQPGQPLMAVVPLREVYVEANFKETQLKDVRIGQPVTIRADLYPDYTYHGKVAGIRAGTGAAFALLPAENATGNWIKVVQRVPIRIELDHPPSPERPLRLGLSLEVTVDTSDRSGGMLMSSRSTPSAPSSP